MASAPSWVVVEVQSGIPVRARFFADLKSAARYEHRLRRKMNPDNDEVGVFEVKNVGQAADSVAGWDRAPGYD